MSFSTNIPISHAHTALSSRREHPIPNDIGILQDNTKLIAFYLPQFHRIEENSVWWGPGFTEWTNTAKAVPNFTGHYQPHIPRELGFYDLSRVDIMYEQAELARNYGVYGFCFYYYWFSGRRILEGPVENFLASDIDLPFCLCWANENWTSTWDGRDEDILLEQKYQEGDEERFIKSLMPYFTDKRYIRIDNKPMLLVYRINELPKPKESIRKWRIAAEKAGLSGLHISVVDFYDISDPREVNADALVEFPPHKFNGHQNHPPTMPVINNPAFAGGLLSYQKMIAQSAYREPPKYNLYRCIIPGWDNTPRRQNTPTIVIGNTPNLYGAWLRYLRAYNRITNREGMDTFIFVNAWNEWGEGCHLEPDLHWGLQFLEETARSAWYDGNVSPKSLDEARKQLQIECAASLKIQKTDVDGEGDKFNIAHYTPPNPLVQRIIWMLRKHSALTKIAAIFYHLIRRIKRWIWTVL